MPVLEILGYLGAVAIGLSLGLIGGGGSILTVPILVYLMSVEPILATAYSLFVVGFSALVGGVRYAKKGLVNYKAGVAFAVPAFITVYSTRSLIVPVLPDIWLTINSFVITKNMAILLLFALLMVSASISMIRKKKGANGEEQEGYVAADLNYVMIAIVGIVVGVLSGMVGAGGGFLIIPALVIFAHLPMKAAVGTSLLIIAVNSLIGFIGDIQVGTPIDWFFLLIFTGIASLGIFIGSYLSKFIDGSKLKQGFGWFVLVMGTFMIVKELLF
ncbi:MAG TPA: sulfite exporter TauE/SafE family protein [Fulvivirga sp.]|nr:sulfite exporter TauE/SafE family protein [Fulvivirga sp.]